MFRSVSGKAQLESLMSPEMGYDMRPLERLLASNMLSPGSWDLEFFRRVKTPASFAGAHILDLGEPGRRPEPRP